MLDVTVMLTVYSIRTKSERKPDLKSSTRKEPRALLFLLRLGNGRRGRREACYFRWNLWPTEKLGRYSNKNTIAELRDELDWKNASSESVVA